MYNIKSNREEMKTMFIALSALLLLGSCNCKTKECKQDNDVKTTVSTAKAENAIHLTAEEFINKVHDFKTPADKFVYKGDKPAIVDFYATWCGPCKMISPILEELAGEYKDQIHVYKIDVDKEGELASAYGIQSIPTLFFLSADQEPTIRKGAMSKDELKKIIEEVLLKK